MTATIEVFRAQAPSGEAAPMTSSQEVAPEKRGQTLPDAVMQVIRPFRPSLSSKTCVYDFDSREHGKGRIVIHMQGALYRERMDEKVMMLEVERAMGWVEPAQTADLPAWQYSVTLQVRNPYLQMLYGLFFMVPGLLIAYSVLFIRDMGAFSSSAFFVLALILIGGGFFVLFWKGMRRTRWWHAARREVRRRGAKMPFDLRLV